MINQLHAVIETIEQQWRSKRLLVVGDVMLDKYVWGEVGRISPEAPVPVVRTTGQSLRPGGAGNVAMNVASLGAAVTLIGFTGGDGDETLLTQALTNHGVDVGLIACAGFPTITKTRILGGRQQMLRLDSENLGERVDADHERLRAQVLDAIPGCDAVVLSDYAKGVLVPELCQAVIAESRRLKIPVLVDPKAADFKRYRGATTICPNLHELSVATREESRNLQAILTAGELLVTELDLDYLTPTLSERGIAVLRPGQRFVAPAIARQVFDVSGAGDTVISVLALCLASHLPIETSVQLANVAAGIVVGKVGTVPVERYELLAALGADISLQANEKVLTSAELSRRVAVWRAAGDTIVFTNGCFDLLHVGHIALLEDCRRFGSRLVLGLNTDASVRRLKGATRPIVGEHERARVMAALSAVDAVVLFDQDTPLELIRELKPNVLAKGGDYTVETVVGHEDVIAAGGRVQIVPTVEGFSTTSIVAKLTNQPDCADGCGIGDST
jgi:D-beta-D-heptose 7-phosphate kinase/D-beta-D-heptose 1-phosphate adenosyltransferase